MPAGRRLYAKELYLKRLSSRDADALCALMNKNREYLDTWLPALPDKITESMVKGWIKQEHSLAADNQRLDLGIFAYDKILLGKISLHSIDFGVQRSASLSYWIDESCVGQGLTTSAAATLIAFTFEELNLHRVWAGVIPDNMPSAAICRKLNMRLEGQCKKAIFINRHWQDTQLFALLETEYEEIAEDWINKGFLGT